MIIEGLIFSWFSLALLFTFALCRAASRPIPKSDKSAATESDK